MRAPYRRCVLTLTLGLLLGLTLHDVAWGLIIPRLKPMTSPGMKGKYEVTGIGNKAFVPDQIHITRRSDKELALRFLRDGKWDEIIVPSAKLGDKDVVPDPVKGVNIGRKPTDSKSVSIKNYEELLLGRRPSSTEPPPKLRLIFPKTTISPIRAIGSGGLQFTVSGVALQAIIAKEIRITRYSDKALTIKMLVGESKWQEIQATSLELDGKTVVPGPEKGIVLRGETESRGYQEIVLGRTAPRAPRLSVKTPQKVQQAGSSKESSSAYSVAKVLTEESDDNVLHYEFTHAGFHLFTHECDKETRSDCRQ